MPHTRKKDETKMSIITEPNKNRKVYCNSTQNKHGTEEKLIPKKRKEQQIVPY